MCAWLIASGQFEQAQVSLFLSNDFTYGIDFHRVVHFLLWMHDKRGQCDMKFLLLLCMLCVCDLGCWWRLCGLFVLHFFIV